MPVFTVDERNRIRARILELAASDRRVVSAAEVGSLANGEGDRWSDLDLTFAVEDNQPLLPVLDDWTRQLAAGFEAAHLFDLPSGPSLYRVLLLPGCLQVDLSVTPSSDFGALGPKFKLLFGNSVNKPYASPPAAKQLFGYAVHHAVRARFCIERGRYWQAEYWISAVRDYALSLACLHLNLSPHYGRGFDQLPLTVRERAAGALMVSLDRAELLRALSVVIELLLSEVDAVREMATKLAPSLRSLTVSWNESDSTRPQPGAIH